VITYEDLFIAYYRCLKNKRNSLGAKKYFFGFEEDLVRLADEINNRTYTISASTVFIVSAQVSEVKELREQVGFLQTQLTEALTLLKAGNAAGTQQPAQQKTA